MKQLTLTKALNLCVLSGPCVLAMFLFSNHLKKSNGLSSSSTSKSGSGVFCDFTEKITQETKKNEPFPVNSALVIQDEKRKNTVQDEVDEDYDDF